MHHSSRWRRFVPPPRRRWQALGVLFLLALLLLVGPESPLASGIGITTASAASIASTIKKPAPNRADPKGGTQSKNHPYQPGPLGKDPAHPPQPILHTPAMPMQAGSVDLHVGQTTTFRGSDGRLDLSIPGNAITADDLAQAQGKLTLQVSQIAPAAGSNAGGNGHWSLGSYLFQLVDARGTLVSHGLRAPITVTYHYDTHEKKLGLSRAYAVLNGARPHPQALKGLAPTTNGTTFEQTLGKPLAQKASLHEASTTLTVTPQISSPSTTLTWQGDASISTFGKPDPFTVDLNAGSLTADESIEVPAGPGGLTPPVNLSYSSEGVNSQHSPTGAVGWVGEGWNLSLGSINWSEHNVLAGCQPTGCGTNWENTWQLSDPFGTSAEIIPPDINVSTFYDDTPNDYCGTTSTKAFPCPILWHTATESHAKIYSYVGPINIGQMVNPPCFRVWLPNGIMEEFGCTADSLQYYYEASVGALVSGWFLDLITDPKGNQIHLTYQRDMASWTSPSTGQTYSYPRDVALSTIEYDSPNCHDAQNMCTGANWAPLVRVQFDAGHSVARFTSALPSGCNTGANLRCDDPLDLSGSGGSAAPLVQSTYLLNDVQVQVRSSGTASWNTLRTYLMSYEQSAPTTIQDPATGKNTSVAGMLDLTQIQETGATGANALLYSGMDNSATSSYAYMKLFDVSSKNIVIGPNTTLSYWIYPQSSTTSSLVSGNNSTCVALDMIFSDGSSLRDSGAVDQNGNQLHPGFQCNHLTLDQWNLVTSNIGAKVAGKTINRINMGYDQAPNTGGYRGFIDDIQVSNPGSTTPLFATDFEGSSPQPTWTNTIEGSNNVGGICCGLSGPEAWAGVQGVVHADSAAVPLRTYSYSTQTNSYEDSGFKPNPTTNCGPMWNTGNGSGCWLWSQSYANNSRFLSSASNGMGLAQSFSWMLARNNTHGVPGGGSNNADTFYCNSHQSGYPCNSADDMGWSHVVLTQESNTTQRLTQNGQGGQQSNIPVTETTSYTYQLSYPLVAQNCSDCVAGMYWGNQNDADYLGYYNAKFMGFAQANVSLPDGAKEVHKYYATEGWGLYDTSQVQCFSNTGSSNPCHNAPWWHLANAAHGHEYESFAYDTDGTTLLKHATSTYQAVCPPSGVAATPTYTTWGNWNGNLVSALDHNNPVAVCDVQLTQQVSETKDGNSGQSVSTTSSWTYDNYGRTTQETQSSNGGTPSQIVHKTSYIWNDGVTATKTSASGTYLIDTPALTATEDSSGNRISCSYVSYDGQGYATGQSSGLSAGLSTTHDTYSDCGNAANSYTPSGQIRTTMVYDAYGNDIATNDADANAGIAGHTGCTINTTQYTDCQAYDSTFATLETSSTNALNQTSSTGFTAGAFAGFGLWPMSATDFNGQTTTYAYDMQGRMTGQTLPGESAGNATRNWVYTTWCVGTAAQAPCIEMDEVNRLDATTTVTTRAFYDGYGRLVETRHPAPNGQDAVAYAYYDAAGHMTFESNSYYVAAYTGPAGPAAFSPPDSTQVGTSAVYDGLERTKSVTDPNSQTTTTSYSVVCGVPAASDTGCYEQTTIVDANAHQRSTLAGGFGHISYDQRYTGNGSATYALYATTAYQYDTAGTLISIKHPDTTTTSTFTYDAAGRKTGQTDPDLGIQSYSYDPNGNLVQAVDARGAAGTIYAGYDGLNRLLWRNTTNSPTGAQASYSYDSIANGNHGIGRQTGETFTGSGGLSGSYSYTYDQRGQHIGLTTTVNGTSYALQKTYDDAGHLTSETYPTGEVVQVAYSQGWLTQVSTTQGSTTTTLASAIHYDGAAGAASHITSMLLGNSMYTYNAGYDAVGRLTSSTLALTSNGLQLFKTQPSYDGVGNVTGVQTTLSAGTDNQQFCYNEQNQLTWAGATGTSPCGTLTPGTLTSAQYQQNYSYDLNGRLATGPLGTYSYGDSKHLHAVTATSGGYSAAYDAAGNMICRAPSSTTTCAGSSPTGQLLSYDAAGRLQSWQDQPTPTSTVNYLYDGEGDRVAMQNVSGGTTTTTAYIDQIEEVQSGGSSSTTTTYYYAGELRIAEAVNGVFSYLGSDRLGSPVVALSAGGVLQAAQLYSPYGAGRYTSGTMPGSIGFTGQHSDAVTGLDYYVSRYYDPSLGQFISPDSALPQSGYDPWGLSRYAYVQGNPETMTDPDGHCWPWCTMAIGAVVGAAIGGGFSIISQAASGHGINWHTVAKETVVGAVTGAISGLAGPGAGILVHTAVGAGSGAAGQVVSNWMNHKPLGDGVLTAAVVGGVLGGASQAAGRLVGKFGGKFLGKFANKAKGFFKACGESFSADTPVTTPDGQKPISTLKEGDQIQAYDPATKQASTQQVQQVFINHDHDLIDVTLLMDATSAQTTAAVTGQTKQQAADLKSHGSLAPPAQDQTSQPATSAPTQETVHTTQSHPWLTSKGWITAGELHVGEHVQRLDGSTATVIALRIVPGEQDMYDLSVSNVHTFAVGTLQAVVHKTACGLSNKQILAGIKQAQQYAKSQGRIAGAIAKVRGKVVGRGVNRLLDIAGGARGRFAPFRQLEGWQAAGRGNCAEFYCSRSVGRLGRAIDVFMHHDRGVPPCDACMSTFQRWAAANGAPIRVFWRNANGAIRFRVFK